MNALLRRRYVTIMSVGLFALLASGCVVPDGGYYDQGTGIGLGYYEPYGFDYGRWGVGYDVGPIRAGYFHDGRAFGRGAQHAYRPAPAFHAIPSIPSHARWGASPMAGRARTDETDVTSAVSLLPGSASGRSELMPALSQQ